MRNLGLAALAALVLLAGCARHEPAALPVMMPGPSIDPLSWNVPQGPGPAMTPVRFSDLPGWPRDHLSQALPGFQANCAQLLSNPGQNLGGELEAARYGGRASQWRGACIAAQSVPAGDDAAARSFFETNFQPFGLSTDGNAIGLFTGYYEPELHGSRQPSARYNVPLYRRPPNPGFTRAQIAAGALARQNLELLWVDDPIGAFFLEVQGSGRVVLPDHSVVRLSYDGQNGQPYFPIGRELVNRGEMTLEEVTMQRIRAWLLAHPDQALDVMNRNPSYVFFRELGDIAPDQGPPGAFGAVALSPLRSAAVDKSVIPLGAPIWVDTVDPIDGRKIQRMLMAQDLGGAIKGTVRADLFFGWGPDAEERAGRMRRQGTEYVLLPKVAGYTASVE